MQQHIDCSNEKQFQYIFSIIRGKGEPFYTSDGIAMFPSLIRLTDPLEAMDIFTERYNNDEIECPFKYSSYIAADELTGLIWAAALMRPSKSTKDMELKSLKKKYKSKGFAAGCSREVIERGAQQLGWELEKLLTMTLQAMAASEDTINEEMAAEQEE